MTTPTDSPLPLARAVPRRDSCHIHRRTVRMDDNAGPATEGIALAALSVLIHRYTSQTEVSIGLLRRPGSPASVTVALTGETRMGELLSEVTRNALPSPPGADLQAVVAMSSVPVGADGLPSAVMVLVRPGGLELLMADADFDAEAADQYALHLGRALAAVCGTSEMTVRDVALLGPDDVACALYEWNQTDEEVAPLYFHEQVAEVAARTPDALAAAWPGGEATFGELDAAANLLAGRLAAAGIEASARVGVCFPRCLESLVAQLACFKLGAAAILLDPDFPDERIRYMVDYAGATAVLTLRAHAPKVSGTCPVLCLDDGADSGDAAPAAPAGRRPAPDDLIHLCYTSGSTGRPKAVMVRFASARNLIHSMRRACGIDHVSRGAWLAAPGYGMVEVEVFSVLAAGGSVHIPGPSTTASPELLRDWLVAERITHALVMKAMGERLWTLDWPTDTALRNVRVCGERVLTWPRAGLPFRVINLYGSAEATIVACCDLTELGERLGEEGRALRLPPVGRPTANVRMYVLSDALAPQPPGVIGEICVAGDSLSAGYLNQPEATAERWIPNPIDPARHPLLYRTGDLARYWPDGSIEIVGRTDGQIKIRGNRVHLGEIEALIAAQPGVQQAAVMPKQDSYGDTWLAAYVEPVGRAQLLVPELRRSLKERLPAFMVPAAYVIDSRLPTTTNGKIDRAALPEPPRTRPDLDTSFVVPRNAVELSLQRLWSFALELDSVGVRDNFFDLGGDSLSAARLAEQVRVAFEIEADVYDLFDRPSIEHMATVVAAAQAA